MATHSIILAWKSHGQRSLMGYSPWGRKRNTISSYATNCYICVRASQSWPTLCDSMDCSSPGSSVYGDSPGKNTGGGCPALLQGIFSTQGLNPGLPTLQVDSLQSELPGKPKNTGVGCHAFSMVSSQPRDLTQVSPHCRQILLQSEPPEKPKNTGVGSLSLFQGIFPTQDLNRGLPDCRRILYNSRKA